MRNLILFLSIFLLCGCKTIVSPQNNSEPISIIKMNVHDQNGNLIPNKNVEIRVIDLDGISVFEIK